MTCPACRRAMTPIYIAARRGERKRAYWECNQCGTLRTRIPTDPGQRSTSKSELDAFHDPHQESSE